MGGTAIAAMIQALPQFGINVAALVVLVAYFRVGIRGMTDMQKAQSGLLLIYQEALANTRKEVETVLEKLRHCEEQHANTRDELYLLKIQVKQIGESTARQLGRPGTESVIRDVESGTVRPVRGK